MEPSTSSLFAVITCLTITAHWIAMMIAFNNKKSDYSTDKDGYIDAIRWSLNPKAFNETGKSACRFGNTAVLVAMVSGILWYITS